MKRGSIILISILACLWFGLAYAAESVTQSHEERAGLHELTMLCVTNSTGGLTPTATSIPITGILYMVETDPGTTAPTDDYDLTLTNPRSLDVMGGALANRDTSNTEWAFPQSPAGSETCVPIFNEPLTLNLSGNSQDSATFTVRIYWLE